MTQGTQTWYSVTTWKDGFGSERTSERKGHMYAYD